MKGEMFVNKNKRGKNEIEKKSYKHKFELEGSQIFF